ncbi:hypothetical protein ACFL0Q_09840 [Thermodesulfobacteriota bacterium]
MPCTPLHSRLRIGIGRPDDRESVTEFVLGHFNACEMSILSEVLDLAGEAIETILLLGIHEGMSRFNNKQIPC